MKNLRLIHLKSVDELRAASVDWDDLWWRSDVAIPTMRAELLAQWIEHFQPRAAFHAIVIADAGRWVAAIPLVASRVGWLLPVGSLPNNPWAACGDLLLDPTVQGDADAVTDLLMAAVADLPWTLLWFNETSPETPRWQTLLRACHRMDVATEYHERFRVGRVEINQPWDLYQKRLSKHHRQAMSRAARRLACEGDVRFEARSELTKNEIEPWLQAAFEVENRSWKGTSGTSVLRTPGMFRFFCRQAEQLAQWGQLEVASLRLDDRLLAYIYGFRAKGVYFANKISYDPHFAAFSPGQLLFNHLLERLHQEGGVQMLDFMGPLTQALARWRPTTYGIGRTVMAPHRTVSRTALYVYRHWWRPMRSLETVAARLHDQGPIPGLDDSAVIEPAEITK